MKTRLKRIWALIADEEGSNLVEMAVSGTVVFAILFGICQFSFAYYVYQFSSDAAREASRYAMVRGSASCANTNNLLPKCNASQTDIQTFVRGLTYPGINPSNLAVTTAWCASNGSTPASWATCSGGTANTPGNMVKVTVSYPLTFGIPFSGSQALNLGSTSEMVVSQ